MSGPDAVAARRHEVRAPDEQRNVQRRLVAEEAVRQLSVIAESLAVIARHDQQRRRVDVAERVQQRRERGVGVSDLAEVEVVLEPRLVVLRRLVRRMRVVDVDPHEPVLALLAAVPLERGLDDVLGPGLLDLELELLVEMAVELVVDVEVVAEPVARVEHVGADERAGGVALRLHARRDRRGLRREAEAGVLAHAVLVRQHAREDVGVRRQRDGVVRVRLVEDAALGGEPVEVRRRAPGVPVEADGVVAQGVDRDEDDVAGGPGLADARGGAAGGLLLAAARRAPPPGRGTRACDGVLRVIRGDKQRGPSGIPGRAPEEPLVRLEVHRDARASRCADSGPRGSG